MFFMKMRISILLPGIAILTMAGAGCAGVKTAYNGEEGSRLVNPARVAVAGKGEQGALPPIAEGPVGGPAESTGGWTAPNQMTGESTQPQFPAANAPGGGGSWGGALSTR